MKLSVAEIRSLIRETLESELEAQITLMMSSPEFRDIASFAEFKFDNEESTFNFLELQALARKIAGTSRGVQVTPSDEIVKSVKDELQSYGLQFVARERERNVRGVNSNPHGSPRFAGNFGGSGLSSGGIGMGGGPGSIGGGYSWRADDKRNLPMSSRRKT